MANEDKDRGIDLLLMSELSYVNMPSDDVNERKTNLTVHDLAKEGIKVYEEQWLAKLKADGEYTDDPDKKTIAQTTYEQRIAAYQRIADDPKYADWTIDGYLNDNANSGFVGYAINTGADNVPIVVSRGSEGKEYPGDPRGMMSATDWLDNYQLAYLPDTKQQEVALKFLERVVDEHKYTEVEITGHSKGGNNAIYSHIAYMQQYPETNVTLNSVTFNAPGFNNKFLEQYTEEIAQFSGNIKEYQNMHDATSSLLNNIGTVEIIQTSLPFKDRDAFNFANHGLWALLGDDGNLMESSPIKNLECYAINYFSNSLAENAHEWALTWLLDTMPKMEGEVSWDHLYIMPKFAIAVTAILADALEGALIRKPINWLTDLERDIRQGFKEGFEDFRKDAIEFFEIGLNGMLSDLKAIGKSSAQILAEVEMLVKAINESRAARQEALGKYLQELKGGILSLLQNEKASGHALFAAQGSYMALYGQKIKITPAEFEKAAAELQAIYDLLESSRKEMAQKYGAMRADWRGLMGDAFENVSQRIVGELGKSNAKLAKLVDDIRLVSRESAETDQQLAQAVVNV